MNNTFPLKARPFIAVFVVDLTQDLRTLNNLLIDLEVEHEPDQMALIEFAVRRVIHRWGVEVASPQPSAVYINDSTLGRVRHYVDNSDKFKLHTLQQILLWAPSTVVDELFVEEGSLYFCYKEPEC